MKDDAKPHLVPLCDRAVSIVESRKMEEGNPHLFIGGKAGKGLSSMAMLELLRGMLGKGSTVHGFRSTFKDWAADCTGYDNIVSEMALGHAISSAAEASYRRGNLKEKRRLLMQDWSGYCAQPPIPRNGNITLLRTKTAS